MFDGQMEMSFGQASRAGTRRQQRQSRAGWWFQRMRQIVDRATDWAPVPPARPVQIWFPATPDRLKRNLALPAASGPRPGADERQICE